MPVSVPRAVAHNLHTANRVLSDGILAIGQRSMGHWSEHQK